MNHNLLKLISEEVVKQRVSEELSTYWLFSYHDRDIDDKFNSIMIEASSETEAWIILANNERSLLNKIEKHPNIDPMTLLPYFYQCSKLTNIPLLGK